MMLLHAKHGLKADDVTTHDSLANTPMAEEWPRAVKGIWSGKLEVLDRLLFVLRNQHANGSPANQMASRQR